MINSEKGRRQLCRFLGHCRAGNKNTALNLSMLFAGIKHYDIHTDFLDKFKTSDVICIYFDINRSLIFGGQK